MNHPPYKALYFTQQQIRRNLIATLLYLLAGSMGMLLSFSSENASPVWPATGVAVAVLLMWGLRCWPGIWLGVFLIDVGFDLSISSLLLSTFTSVITTTTTVFVAWLAHRYLQTKLSSITSDWRLAWFLICAGPLTCMFASGIIILSMYWGGHIEEGNLLGEWLRWWSGNTLGILLFTPISLLLWPKKSEFGILMTGSMRYILPLIITAILLVSAHIGLAQLQELRVRNQNQVMMEIISNDMTKKLAETLLPFTGLANYFSASQEVTRKEFSQYTNSFLNHPAILSVDWAPRVEADNRKRFEEKVSAEGFKNFQINELDPDHNLIPASKRSEYYPVLFTEPLVKNRSILGLDHNFDPQRVSAMMLAQKNKSPIASGLLPLARTNRQATLVFIPVWLLGDTKQHKKLAGYVVGTIDLQKLFSPLLQHAQEHGLLSQVIDTTSNNLIISLSNQTQNNAQFEWNYTFKFWGQEWRLEMQPIIPYWQHGVNNEERFFLGFGMLTALLAVFATLSNAGRHHDIRLLVTERTAQLRQELEARTAAEASLHISEERYRRLIELSPFGIIVQYGARFRFVNTSAMQMFGASCVEQLLGQKLLYFVHPDSKDIVAEHLQQRTEEVKTPESIMVHYRRLDGSHSWVEFTSVAYEYEGHLGSLVLLHDISDRIRVEEQRDRFFTLSLDLYCIVSTDGYFKSVNPSFTRVLGWSEQELLSQPLLDFIHPDDIDATRNELIQLDTNDFRTLKFENRYRCKDGSWRRLSWKALPQPGRLVFASGRDITEQHQVEQRLIELNIELEQRIKERSQALAALHAQKEEVRAVLDHLIECVIIIDSQGIIQRINPAITPLLGYHPTEVLGHDIICLLKNQHDLSSLHELETNQRHLIGSSREVTGLHKKGHTISLELSFSEYQINDESFFICTLRDIRERKAMITNLTQAREQAEQASRAKSAFLATMSHEIRTPMNGVVSLVDVLMHDQLSPYQHDLINTIRQSATHLLTIIDGILDFSKSEAGKLDINLVPTEVTSLLQEQCRALTPLASTREVDLQLRLSIEAPLWIYTDPLRLRQILTNLIGNAIKFSAREHQTTGRLGKVEVRATLVNTESPTLRLEIEDNGIGIASEHLSNLFTPFTQMENSTTRRFGGTGLGLSICKRLIELMSGSIDVESQPAQGAQFRVTLPALSAPAVSPQPTLATAVTCKHKHNAVEYLILIAEDDDINQKVIQHQLNLLGYRCEVAHNGWEALEKWRNKPYHLLITDLHMPKMDGYELTESIRREEQPLYRLPIIALTANAQRDEGDRALSTGVDEYLIKPIKLSVLQQVLIRRLQDSVTPAPENTFHPIAESALLDSQVLGHMLGNDPLLIIETLQDYVSALTSLGIKLEDFCTHGDYPAVVALAHRLKSSSRAVGAQRLGGLYELLEEAAKHHNMLEVNNVTARLPELREATLKAIKQQLIHMQRFGHKNEDASD